MTVKFSLASLLGGVEMVKNDVKEADANFVPGALNVCQELQLIDYPRAWAFAYVYVLIHQYPFWLSDVRSVEGFVYQQYHSVGKCKDIQDSKAHFRKAHGCYMKAADIYPKDDEYHTCASRSLPLSVPLTQLTIIP